MPSWRDFTSAFAGVATVCAWIVLGIFLMAFFVGRRLWCHLCPIGLMTSWFNRGSGLQLVKTNATHCNRCSACADACPMGLTHVRDTKDTANLGQAQCILCMRCVDACPRDGCLKARFFGLSVVSSRMRVKRSEP